MVPNIDLMTPLVWMLGLLALCLPLAVWKIIDLAILLSHHITFSVH